MYQCGIVHVSPKQWPLCDDAVCMCRSYGTPPTMVMNVMSAVCVLLKEPTEWSSIRHIMVDPVAFLKRLTSLDKNSVSDKVSLSV